MSTLMEVTLIEGKLWNRDIGNKDMFLQTYSYKFISTMSYWNESMSIQQNIEILGFYNVFYAYSPSTMLAATKLYPTQ